MDTTWALAADRGPMSVTMSQVAQEAGIGRATLYKYFPDVESILHAKHERHVLGHLARLEELRLSAPTAMQAVEMVTRGYAEIRYHRARHGAVQLSALTHRPERVAEAEGRLVALLENILEDAITSGVIRGDVAASELALYVLHALGAAGDLPSERAVHRLVSMTLGTLKPTSK